MWDDEDNNPYGSFARHDSNASDTPGLASPSALPYRPATPPSEASSPAQESPEYVAQRDMSDVDYNEEQEGEEAKAPKKGGYDARVEQWLYEHPDQLVLITMAGKDGVNFIQYTINCGGLEVKRRYSEFASLRATLVNLHPTLIVPPIPEKHTMADYAAKPTKAKEDAGIIELRKRMLAVFLNRCRKMKDVLEDGVFWRFLDPYTSWNDVLNSPPVTDIPKQILKAPPLDTAHPTQAHSYLPVPSSSAKLKSGGPTSSSGTPVSPANALPSVAAHTTPGPQIFGRFPPESRTLSEEELDPYFVHFETSSKELENLLQGPMEKVNRRLLMHLGNWGEDMADLGARFNAFSLSEQSQTLAAAIEKTGQAVDSTYIATAELSSSLSASFSEPMRESAQFAGVVRSVLRYRVLKRIQEDMTKDELEKKRNLLESLERSEAESKRLEQHLSGTGHAPPARSRATSNSSQRSSGSEQRQPEEDRVSIDSDFPPTHGDQVPSSAQGVPDNGHSPPGSPHKKSPSGNFVTNKLFGSITHAFRGMADVDPEKTRRDQIGKTRDSLVQLEQALGVAEKDTKDASAGVMKDLRRFQDEKENDLRRYMMEFAQCHVDWAKRNKAAWEEAKAEVQNIQHHAEDYPRNSSEM
ncbi:sorting nexin-like protein-41 [Cucurbitaria berberidis CBS 394.84]|uniref:Sorting nexin-like protein-41 n=1 Tax=Cucurbitaria berberidis CBS 394.84 TaxID=1168544 RepID=A0A9P4GLK3_9PLEO|nr:sorting nexin-like protein-41 [Cucurbitaria berberidis CBS 394.84]KAF1847467.1 sorting nexin-like protein-41 [Cucurbitaria berberidis CBS 394.84]